MITTNNCCFCASLRTGSIIIGVLQLLGSVLFTISYITNLTTDSSDSTATPAPKWISLLSLLFTLMQGVFSALLLLGIKNQNHVHVFYYLWGESVYLIIRVVFQLILTFILINEVIFIAMLFSYIIILALPGYFLWVVYSYYKEMHPGLPN